MYLSAYPPTKISSCYFTLFCNFSLFIQSANSIILHNYVIAPFTQGNKCYISLGCTAFNFKLIQYRGFYVQHFKCHSMLMKRDYIDETVWQWLISSTTHSHVTTSVFSPPQMDVQFLAIDQLLHCTKWNASINSFHPIELQPISMDSWHMFLWNICLPSGSWLTGWQFLFVKGMRGRKEMCKFCLWFYS